MEAIWNHCRAQHKGGGPWLFGRFTIADAMYIPVALRFVTYGVQLRGEAQDYIEQAKAHPQVQEWIDDARQEKEVMESSEVGR